MKNLIKNSSGKIMGESEITEDKIIINNFTKPLLIIENKEIITAVLNNDNNGKILTALYDKYYLSVGEIASLYQVCYSNMNKQLKKLDLKTGAGAGRRNRSFGKPQSEATKKKKSETMKKKVANGEFKVPTYERTPEIKEKISQSLKSYYKEHPQDPTPHIKNWENGVYNNVDFHIGIGGHFKSIKNNKNIFFRSLLELYYMLLLEEDINIKSYSYEAVKIKCDNGHIYTPDIQIDNTIIELKSYKYIHSSDNILNSFNYKKQQAEYYCLQNNLQYKVIFDIDIGFDSARFKRHLANNPGIVNKYQIIFNQPERMVIK